MNQIKHVQEPKRLYLVWQPDFLENDLRRKVAELVKKNNSIELRYVFDTEDFKAAKQKNFEGFPAFPLESQVYNLGVLDIFMRRLPPRSRRDYHLFLEALRLPNDVKISDFALLGYAEAKLPGDSFSIINPWEDVDPPCEYITEVTSTFTKL